MRKVKKRREKERKEKEKQNLTEKAFLLPEVLQAQWNFLLHSIFDTFLWNYKFTAKIL